MPASEKDPEGWSATDKITVVLETAGLNTIELSAYCRESGLYPEQVERWRQASKDANKKPVLTLKEQKELERLRAQDQKEIKRLKQELRRNEKALAEETAADCLNKDSGLLEKGRGRVTSPETIAGMPWTFSMSAWPMVPAPVSWRSCWAWGSPRCSAAAAREVPAMWHTASEGRNANGSY